MIDSGAGGISRPTADYKARSIRLNTLHRVVCTPRRVEFVGHNPRDSRKYRKLEQSNGIYAKKFDVG